MVVFAVRQAYGALVAMRARTILILFELDSTGVQLGCAGGAQLGRGLGGSSEEHGRLPQGCLGLGRVLCSNKIEQSTAPSKVHNYGPAGDGSLQDRQVRKYGK